MLNESCLVSVIVPIYNVGKYVSKCIQSICEQTYSNIEIVLVDDGSTDNSGAICDEYYFIALFGGASRLVIDVDSKIKEGAIQCK